MLVSCTVNGNARQFEKDELNPDAELAYQATREYLEALP